MNRVLLAWVSTEAGLTDKVGRHTRDEEQLSNLIGKSSLTLG